MTALLADTGCEEPGDALAELVRGCVHPLAAGDEPVGADVARLVDDGNWPAALALFEQSWIDRWYNTEPELLRTSLAAVPGELLREHRGTFFVAVLVGAVTPPDGWDGLADLEDLAQADHDDEALIHAHSVAAAQLRAQGRMSEAMACLEAARPILGRLESAVVDATGGFASFMRLQFGVTALHAGDVVAARGWLRSTSTLRAPQRFPFLLREAAVTLALTWALTGDSAQARACLDEAATIPRTNAWIEAMVDTTELIARQLVAVANLDLTEAERCFQRRGKGGPTASAYGEMWPFALLARVNFLRMSGKSEAGLELCHEMAAAALPELAHDGFATILVPVLMSTCYLDLGQIRRAWETIDAVTIPSPYIELVKAKALYGMGELDQADEIARRGLEQRWGRPWLAVEFMGILAAVEFSHGDKDAARNTLIELCELAESRDLYLHFDAVPRPLMAEFADTPVIGRALEKFDVAGAGTDLPEPAVKAAFTERERAVLTLVRQGLKRDEVAEQLGVSVATVKSQIRSSYAKLGVTTRRQALAKLDQVTVLF